MVGIVENWTESVLSNTMKNKKEQTSTSLSQGATIDDPCLSIQILIFLVMRFPSVVMEKPITLKMNIS